jgi:S1-C subfamily serine protease
VKIDYMRGGEALTAKVAPREKGKVEGEEKVFSRWGFTAKEINRFNEPDLAFFAPSGGVYVAATAWEGNAANSGLKRRDIVKSMDGKKVETLEDLDALYKKALDGLPAQDKMSVTVDRKGRELHFILKYREDTEKDDLQ